MTKTISTLALALTAVAALAAPLRAAQAQQVNVRIDTPEFGIRIGTPLPRVVYAPPLYAPPVYAPPVYAPPVVVAPPRVVYPEPRYVYAPAPRIVVPAPVFYARPWRIPPGHAKHRARYKDHREYEWHDHHDR